jgi:hypothetical protein
LESGVGFCGDAVDLGAWETLRSTGRLAIVDPVDMSSASDGLVPLENPSREGGRVNRKIDVGVERPR